MRQRYSIIVADPPWDFRDRLRMSQVRRGAAANYPTLTVDEIAALPVGLWAAPDAVLALWVPCSRLFDGMSVMNDWGFSQDQLYVWIKTTAAGRPKMGMGRRFRGCKEIALIGYRGRRLPVCGKSELDVCLAANPGHSRKPEALQDSLDRIYPRGRRLELFARRVRPGWLCVGNDPACDTPGADIRLWSPPGHPIIFDRFAPVWALIDGRWLCAEVVEAPVSACAVRVVGTITDRRFAVTADQLRPRDLRQGGADNPDRSRK